MTTLPETSGRCVGCNRTGPVGTPCPEPACTGYHLHFIPEQDHRRLQPGTNIPRDPNIGTMLNDWLVVGLAGRGGFSNIYLAIQVKEGMRCALKLMQPAFHTQTFARDLIDKFKSEARTLATLSHPNIVRLFSSGMWGHSPYLVMEYVEATSLKEEIVQRRADQRPFDAAEVAVIFQQICNGLHEAHRKGIVHRDIKPENILLQRDTGYDYHVRIVDFGLARFVTADSRTKALFGTPAYMAPELQLEGKVTIATDIYALGAMLYETLFLATMAPGATGVRSGAASSSEQLSRLTAPDGSPVPAPLRNVLERALKSRPENRYQSAATFSAALLTALHAEPDDDAEDEPRAVHSPRGPMALLTLVLVAVAALAAASWLFSRPPDAGLTGPDALVPVVADLAPAPSALDAVVPDARPLQFEDLSDVRYLEARTTADLAPTADSAQHELTSPDRPPSVVPDVTPDLETTDLPSAEIEDVHRDEQPEPTTQPDVKAPTPHRRPRLVTARPQEPPAPREPDVTAAVADVVEPAQPAIPVPEPQVLHVLVDSKPQGATVTEGTRFLGHTPVSVTLLEGHPRQVKLTLKGYADVAVDVDGSRKEIHRALAPTIWE